MKCEHSDDGERFICSEDGITISASKVCDGIKDCAFGTDEAHCNHTYGVTCKKTLGSVTYDVWQPPAMLCRTGNVCDEGEDERDCANSTHYARWCKVDNYTTYLNERQLCAPLSLSDEAQDLFIKLCTDNREQLNCSDSFVECQVENATTQLQSLHICDGYVACDNGIDEVCLTPEQNCHVHKHRLCDKINDCKRGSDESHESCNTMIDEECERLVTGNNTKIPLDWLCDGTVDCKDGKDEDKSNWKLCGIGERERCRPQSQECEEQFICPQSKSVPQYVEYEKLCDNVDSCTGENSICQTAQDTVEPLTKIPDLYGSKRVGYCLPGIDIPELNCSKSVFTKLENVSTTIVRPFSVNIPVKKLRCKHMFGETYVYTSCSNRCEEKNAVCPLTILNSSSCIFMENRILLPSLTNELTVVKRKKGFYSNEIFACRNGNCLSYDEVCNLADNCGDGSDEDGCINHIKCNFSDRKYLTVESQCDGRIDCYDLSDECNGRCGARIIDDPALRVFAWVVGILASIINATVLAKNGRDVFRAESKVQLINSTMILIIAFGDLLIGIYLLCIVITDHLYNTEYCPEQFRWLVSRKCSLLGIASTIGSQVSLFAMTCLSLYRANSMRNLLAPRHLSRKAIVMTFLTGAFILIASTTIAVLPELGLFEDYFINGLYYHGSPLFVGTPNKYKHLEIIEKRFGRISQAQVIPWETIRVCVTQMFTQDVKKVEGQSLGFYGNDGVCLFKFFVKPDDPQHIFSLAIMIVNFVCFILITGSYIFINYITMASSAASSDDSTSNERSRKMQRKITVIILTDFVCWVPFILIGMLHFSGTIDATKYYGLCSIVVLPLNSVVNPMLYDGSVVDLVTTSLSRSATFARTQTRRATRARQTRVIVNLAVDGVELEKLDQDTNNPEEAKQKEDTNNPEVAKQEEDTNNPEVAKKEEDTNNPEVAKQEEDTNNPEVTKQEEDTNNPEVAKQEEDTNNPEVAKQEEDTNNPEEAKQEEDTNNPEEAKQEEDTNNPEVAKQEEDTNNPEEAKQEEDTNNPEVAKQEEDTNNPEVAKQEEDTNNPEEAKQEEKSQ